MSPTAAPEPTALELDRAHVFHSWSAQATLAPMTIAGGLGCEVWDETGRRFLDFSSQLVNVNIGHQHPRVVAAIKTQAEVLTTVSPAYANLTRGRAAQAIAALAPEGMDTVFFTNAGADANENAIRMARLHTGRRKILSGYRSYHGNTGTAIVATGDWRRMPNEYAEGHAHFFTPYLFRSDFWATSPEQECERALAHLRRVVECEGPHSIAAILLETIPGTAGVLVPPPGYLAGVRAIADEFGIVLILDEVMAGFGRTGRWFAFEDHDVVPDLVTFAKGVNSGYVPAGGVIISDAIAATFADRVFPGGLTYSGHPLAMAAIVATLGAMADDDVVGNARAVGEEHITPALADLASRHRLVGEVRGVGVFHAIELVADGPSRTPLDEAAMGRIKAGCLTRGLLPFVSANRIHVVPPCTVSPDEVFRAFAIYDEVLTEEES
ncbi:MAG: aspartate aminotransferase family protein [Cellulomonadaceae bacterium]